MLEVITLVVNTVDCFRCVDDAYSGLVVISVVLEAALLVLVGASVIATLLLLVVVMVVLVGAPVLGVEVDCLCSIVVDSNCAGCAVVFNSSILSLVTAGSFSTGLVSTGFGYFCDCASVAVLSVFSEEILRRNHDEYYLIK